MNSIYHFRTTSKQFLKKLGTYTSVFSCKQRYCSKMNPEAEYVEAIVCKESDLNENEMKECQLADAGKILLIRQHGKINAIGALCPHADAPFKQAALGNGRIRCQRHGACFSITTGDIEDYPTQDALPCFEVKLEDGNVIVRAKRTEVETSRRTKEMVSRSPSNEKSVVIIGGGPSGSICAETLRQEGYTGRIFLICAEKYLPYDRVKVTKQFDRKIDSILLRKPEFYSENGIDVKLGVSAIGVQTDECLVDLSDGSQIKYDYLYVATGLSALKAQIPGAELKNVLVLQEHDDAKYLSEVLKEDSDVVVLGSSFIAIEAASSVFRKIKKVTVVARSSVPFKEFFGEEVGEGVLNLYLRKGINFITNSGIESIIDDGSGYVSGVKLIDGTQLKADIVIMGVGGKCNTKFLETSKIKLMESGAVDVNKYLQTNIPNVYAGGDIAYAPVWTLNNQKKQITHYGLAHYHGKIAAMNIAGKKTELKSVPFFWTKFLGYGIPYSGFWDYDDVIYHGNAKELKFVAFYMKGDEVVAVSSCQNHPFVANFAEVLADGKKLFRKDLESGDMLAWAKHQKTV